MAQMGQVWNGQDGGDMVPPTSLSLQNRYFQSTKMNKISNKLCTYVPSKPRTASSASRGSSNSTKANPGGFRATHTFRMFPYLEKTFSISYLEAFVPKFPT